ncbi:RNA-binding domain-containing protein [Chiayiivirga flava]|uniref:ATP-dependent DNA helicase RecG n=1 Tax=Chiayiivirga flava TaxID=659595 RepID=A0A7W8D5E5_9GAMM|nr:RNA-binding domain-containing protein [Chiayiivirga flava]MBB5207867.1 ATP-dependent DNA helicase RecG [Chiayiivirga flava]
MQVREVSKADALALSCQPEGHFYDRKAAQIKGAKLQKIVCAFANADGGDVYVGIADDKDQADPEKRWAGAPSMEEFNQLIQSLMELSPSPPMTLEFLRSSLSENYVLHIQVDKSQSVHQTADGTVYERKGAQSLPIREAERITALGFAKGASSYEDMQVDSADAEDVVDSDEINVFLGEYSPKTDPLDLSLNKGLIDRKTFKPKACGLLLFSNEPSVVIPKKCSVKIIRYETKEDDPERDHLGFTETIEGPLYPLIRASVERVTEIMSSINVWTTDGAKSMQYPPETLWEIVVNAVIHRDYSVSDDVQILIFDNRIEVLSPGRLPGFVSRENILDVRYARNPKIVGMLSKYKNAPNKDIGEGLNTAFQKMKEWKMRNPEILEEDNYVRVVIPHASLATPQEAIMEFLSKNTIITNKQARDITGIKSENAVKSEFYKLRDAGSIEMIPELKGNKAAWRLKAK